MPQAAMRVLSVTSEAVPLVKTGGLADVAGALPGALASHGVEVTTLLPGYPAVMDALGRKARSAKPVHVWPSLLGEPARALAGTIDGHRLLVLDAPTLFAQPGNPYLDAHGLDRADNWLRFAAFARAGADLASGIARGVGFDLVHAHDWQAAMVPAYLRFAPVAAQAVPSVLTIHNMAFQGWFAGERFAKLGLPEAAFTIDGVEYHGGVGMLKAGLASASAVTTVSPTYATEIRTPQFGMGLEGLIVARGEAVSGILNGIDTAIWNPATDPLLPAPYTTRTLGRRQRNRAAVEARFGLDPTHSGDGPLFVVISRLTWQKGMDVLLGCLDHLAGTGARLALLGSGDAALEAGFLAAAERHRGRIGVVFGYDEALSHLLQGGGDAILVPSRYEPCGLTQLYGLAYGCIPVVARTGGLADTVIDANPAALAAGVATGVQHGAVTEPELVAAIDRTRALFARPEQWQRLQRNAMACDFSWRQSGRAYAALYRGLLAA